MSKLKVLISIDDPELARKIVETTCNIIDKEQSEITLLNVLETTLAEDEYFYKEPQKFIQHEAEKSDFALIEDYLETNGYDYKGFVYKEGDASKIIIDTATKEKFDLIVVGSHNKHRLQRFFLGSVSYRVLRHGKVPTLVIKPDRLSIIQQNEKYSALVAIDNTEYSEYITQSLGKFLDKKRAEINLISVTVPFQEMVPADAFSYYDFSKIQEEVDIITQQSLRNAANDIARQGLRVVNKYSLTGDPARTIIEEALKIPANLIVVGSHEHEGFAGWLMGSVSTKIYEDSPVSVLVIKKQF